MSTTATRLKNTIDTLLKLREEVIIDYCKLSGISNFDNRDPETGSIDAEHLRTFCTVMVDYVAIGHFEVYQRIIEGKERRKAVKEVAREVYPAIAETTDYLVDFNDKYDAFEGSEADVEMLLNDLPRLAEIISARSELEDQILSSLQSNTEK